MRSDKPRGRWGVFWLALGLWCEFVAAASAQVTHGPPRIRNVYIPADELKLLFDSSAKGVLMPREKVLTLWQEAQRHGPAPLAPPTDVAISQAAYKAQLGDDELRLNGRIRIAKLRGGWQTVDLPFGGLAIESAQLGGEPARFGRKDDGTLFLVLEKEGRFELELKMSAPLASKGGDLATTLKLPPLPASEILVRLPKGKQLQVGETTLQADGTENATQLFRVAVDRGGLVPLVISERFAGGNRRPLVLANSRTTDRIEPAGLRWEVLLDLDVYARATDSFQIQLPGALNIAEVEAPELAAMDNARAGRRHGGPRAQFPQAVPRPAHGPAAGTGARPGGERVERPHAPGAPVRVARRAGVGLLLAFLAVGGRHVVRCPARAAFAPLGVQFSIRRPGRRWSSRSGTRTSSCLCA